MRSLRLRLLVVRTVLGGLFVGHGAQKLFGWFGGHGPEGTGQFLEQVGVRPGRPAAIGAGAAETIGGTLMFLGFLMPVAGASLSSVMFTAIRHVHRAKGPWVTEGGYEYNLVMLATIFAITEAGPGRISLDAKLGTLRCGTGWAIAAIAAGAAGSELIERISRAASTPDAAAAEAQPSADGSEAPVQAPA